MADLEEQSLESLPPTCASCGTALTGTEKRLALEAGAGPVMCTVCAAEAAPALEAAEEAEPDS